MGNSHPASASASASGEQRRDRHKSGDSSNPYSPGRIDGQAFTFEKRPHQRIHLQHSEEDSDPLYCKGPKSGSGSNGAPKEPSKEQLRQQQLRMEALRKADKKLLPVVIKWEGGGKEVFISGTFNDWHPIPMVKSETDFVAIVDLPEGEHEYKFKVDGDWKCSEEPTRHNDLGTLNNFVAVQKRDFEEFENDLLRDPNDAKKDTKGASDEGGGGGSGGGGDTRTKSSSAPTKEEIVSSDIGFSQDIPDYPFQQKVRGPPVLPPHLQQVILNKDTPVSCEPTLLPEPNHVMLNHMYALSIREGMMVLSATHRYRKKCVTTLIYRPI